MQGLRKLALAVVISAVWLMPLTPGVARAVCTPYTASQVDADTRLFLRLLRQAVAPTVADYYSVVLSSDESALEDRECATRDLSDAECSRWQTARNTEPAANESLYFADLRSALRGKATDCTTTVKKGKDEWRAVARCRPGAVLVFYHAATDCLADLGKTILVEIYGQPVDAYMKWEDLKRP